MDNKMILIAAIFMLVVMNVTSFSLMGMDKRRARRGQWRIPERTLFLAAICFGGLGGVLGMKVFRHKTKHWYFRIFFPLLLALQIIVLAAGCYYLMR